MQKYARKETILIKCFQNVNVASPCWVFRDEQDNKVKRSPHHKMTIVGYCQVQIALNLMPVAVCLLELQ